MGAAVLEQLRDDAVTAIAAGDYATARAKVDAAIAHIKLTPNFSGGLSSLQWQSNFDDLLKMIRRGIVSKQPPVTRVPIYHKRPEIEDCI